MSIRASVEYAAKAWGDSPYYSEAERWTYLFWDQSFPFRRYFDRLDLNKVLELGSGHGRHAAQIVDMVGHLTLVDIVMDNLDKCRERLRNRSNLSFLLGDGYSFYPLADESLTAIYCYDSMVHFAPDVVCSYLRDTNRVLAGGGMALYHHSNYAETPPGISYERNPHARNHMTQKMFSDLAQATGLEIIASEILDWGGTKSLDCLTLVSKPSSQMQLAGCAR